MAFEMGCFDSTLNEGNVTFWLTRKQFWKFRSHTEQRSKQGKPILSFDALGLEIAFSLENEKTVQIEIRYMILSFFFNFSFLDLQTNKSHESQTKKFHANSRGLDFFNICQDYSNWQKRRNMFR